MQLSVLKNTSLVSGPSIFVFFPGTPRGNSDTGKFLLILGVALYKIEICKKSKTLKIICAIFVLSWDVTGDKICLSNQEGSVPRYV